MYDVAPRWLGIPGSTTTKLTKTQYRGGKVLSLPQQGPKPRLILRSAAYGHNQFRDSAGRAISAQLSAVSVGAIFVTGIYILDQPRITQVLDNLLGNALKFTPAGGKITLQVSRLENEVQFSVSDTGPGIPDEALGRIFEPYWQVQKTRSGMGLGLFIAKTIVESHGGRIWVESTVGQGTTFHFTLPSRNPPPSSKDV